MVVVVVVVVILVGVVVNNAFYRVKKRLDLSQFDQTYYV